MSSALSSIFNVQPFRERFGRLRRQEVEMRKAPKRIPLVKETVLALSLQAVHGGDLPATSSVYAPTVSNACGLPGEDAVVL